MTYNDMTTEEQADMDQWMDQWMDDLDAEYLEEAFISERAAEEAERRFEHYQW